MNNTENNKGTLNMTDAEMEAQFIERNSNLKKSLNNIVDKIDTASTKTHDYLAQNVVGNDTLPSATNATKTSNMLEQNNAPTTTGFGINTMDAKLMNSIKSDVNAMHSTNPEQFEEVATKMDETFGHNALV
ncbi:hypothetical protein FB192DRAFT_1293578 [Mucor lusitanicus]|uniref:Uncharacterized protein n=2 Tax=Mucor circinelloides f. lusitanicus TaxID=29924 RepID=A0A168JVC2_MUCCL|nr:hypothetical protein FB192DRAFT_1293578 [Mucor lusitanicus]OAD01662.1 hypothetical protein MUCCIDRAFT_163629 [Mucor lusitanicus CBS 277.49]